MGNDAAAPATGRQADKKNAMSKGRSLVGMAVLALSLTGVATGFLWWKQSRYVSPTLVGKTDQTSLPDVLDSVQADHKAPDSVPPLTTTEAAPVPAVVAPTDTPPVTQERTATAAFNPLQLDEGQLKPVDLVAPVTPAVSVQPPVDNAMPPAAQSQEQRIALLEQQVAQLMASANTRRSTPRPVAAAASTERAGQVRRNTTAKTTQRTTSGPEVALLAVDMWGGKPSVVVGTTDPSNQQVRVLKPGDSLNGVTLKQVDVSGQKATFEVGGRTLELTREN
jgi:hypothetical protein